MSASIASSPAPALQTNALGQTIGFALPHWKPLVVPARPTLQGRHVRVEPLNAARHGSDLWRAIAQDKDARMWTYLPNGPYAQEADYAAWLAQAEASRDPMFFAIVEQGSGQALGVASYLRIDPANGVIEVGHIAFAPRLQRSTAASEAMYLMMRHVFELGYRRYEWKCNALNAPSRRAALRLGFSFEGVFRQAAVVKGCNRDTAWYAMIDRDWPALRQAWEQWLDEQNFEQGRQRTSLATLTRPLLVNVG